MDGILEVSLELMDFAKRFQILVMCILLVYSVDIRDIFVLKQK